MPHCITNGCYNNSSPEKTAKGISLYCLPLKNPPHLLGLCKKQLRLENPTLTASVRTCSVHFEKSCFITINPIKERLVGPTKRQLKKDAIPTIFP